MLTMSAYRPVSARGFGIRMERAAYSLTHDVEVLDESRFPFQHNPGLVVLPRRTLELADAINGVLALIGPYFKACRGYKIRITEDGVCTIRPSR
jgi:hypothetical protein